MELCHRHLAGSESAPKKRWRPVCVARLVGRRSTLLYANLQLCRRLADCCEELLKITFKNTVQCQAVENVRIAR